MTELEKLSAYLKEHHYRILNHYSHEGNLYQVDVFNSKGTKLWDAACNAMTYGADEGLLEVMGTVCKNRYDDVEGWLTADDIIKRLEDDNNK